MTYTYVLEFCIRAPIFPRQSWISQVQLGILLLIMLKHSDLKVIHQSTIYVFFLILCIAFIISIETFILYTRSYSLFHSVCHLMVSKKRFMDYYSRMWSKKRKCSMLLISAWIAILLCHSTNQNKQEGSFSFLLLSTSASCC